MTFCANTDCPASKEYVGGRFVLYGGKWYCANCAANPTIFEPGKARWDFTTTHLNGKPIHVKSLKHLRQLEKKFGVSNTAANNMERNWNTPPPDPAQSMPRGGRGIMGGFGEER